MSVEDEQKFLQVLFENPHLSYEKAKEKVICLKKEHSGPKGDNSELIVSFLISRIPKVLRVLPFNRRIGDLDADKFCILDGAAPVYLQIKTAEADALAFRAKIERRLRRGIDIRFASLSFDKPFDLTIEDFCDQVNNLEHRLFLKPVKF